MKWINANDKLPNKDERILMWIIFSDEFDNYEMMSCGSFGDIWYCDYSTGGFVVTHWAYLPDAPRGRK